jgi:uncharacterized small protein (TIGR04563 family)
MAVEVYYYSLVSLLIISFGIGLLVSTPRARYLAYAGVVSYIIGLFIGEYAKNKRSIYIPDQIITELETEAKRQDRTLSWLIKRAWLESRDKIKKYPSGNP